MKAIISAVAATVAALGMAADLIVPKTSEKTMTAFPLGEGAAAYAENANGTVSLFVGAGGGNRKIVADPFTLRGYKSEEIPFNKYLVTHTSGITYNASAGTWQINHNNTGVVEHVWFKVSDGTPITAVEYDYYASAGIGTLAGCVSVTNKGHVCEFSLTKRDVAAVTVNISDVVLFANPFGSNADYVDLTKLHVNTIDTWGKSELGAWRESVAAWVNQKHFADEWYKYVGSNDVTMAWKDFTEEDLSSSDLAKLRRDRRAENYGNGFWFDGPGVKRQMYKIYTDTATTNFCVKAGGVIPLEFEVYGDSTNDLRFTGISHDASSKITTLQMSGTLESFNKDNLEVWFTTTLKTNDVAWTKLASSAYTVNVKTGEIKIPNQTSATGFYKLVYGGSSVPQGCNVYLRGNVKFESFSDVYDVSSGDSLAVYIAETVAAQPATHIRYDLTSVTNNSVTAANGRIINASVGAGPLNITVPSCTTGKSDDFTIRITATSDTQLGTVQGPDGETVALEWLSTPLTTAGSIHSAKKMYLKMTRVDTWTFACKAEEVQ